ncbi:hypothetical protein Tco_1174426 [Tanacetum coccineum]
MVRAALATLGLVNENDTSISSTDLANSSPLKMRYFSPIWRVLMLYIVKCLGDIDIANILFSNLIVQLNPSKKDRKSNICYTRYLSFIIEHLLGEAYKNDNLKTFKPHHISATSFKIPFENEVPLTAHMGKVTNLSPEPIKSLIPPSRESRKKKNPASSKPTTLKIVRESSSFPQVDDTQPDEELTTIANATQSINAFKLAEDLGNHLEPVDAEKGMILPVEGEVKDSGITSIGNISFEELFDQHKNKEADKENYESPFDTESKINIIRKEVLMTTEHKEELSKTNEDTADKIADKIEESIPRMVANALEERIHEMLSNTLKTILPDFLLDSIKKALQSLTNMSKRLSKLKMADLQKKLIKEINTKVGISVQCSVRKEVKVVNELLKYVFMKIDKSDVNLRKLVNLIMDLVFLIDTTSASAKAAPERENMSTQENKDDEIIVPAPGEHLGKQAPPISTALVVQSLEEEPPIKKFGTFTGSHMTIKDAKAQMEEIKRLAALKCEKEEYEKRLKVLTPKELEWVKTQAEKLGIHPPPQLIAFGLSASEKKRKTSSEIIKEVCVKEDIVVDEMHRNLVPPPRVVGFRELVIREPNLGIFFYNRNVDLVFQREEEFHLATTAQLIRI